MVFCWVSTEQTSEGKSYECSHWAPSIVRCILVVNAENTPGDDFHWYHHQKANNDSTGTCGQINTNSCGIRLVMFSKLQQFIFSTLPSKKYPLDSPNKFDITLMPDSTTRFTMRSPGRLKGMLAITWEVVLWCYNILKTVPAIKGRRRQDCVSLLKVKEARDPEPSRSTSRTPHSRPEGKRYFVGTVGKIISNGRKIERMRRVAGCVGRNKKAGKNSMSFLLPFVFNRCNKASYISTYKRHTESILEF